MQFPFPFLCFACILGVVSAYPLPFRTTNFSGRDALPVGNEDYTDVTRKEQLWRFLVGDGNDFNVGERFICLRAQKYDQVVSATTYLFLGYRHCRKNSRLEVEFVSGNEVKLKTSNNNRYVSCANDGRTTVTDWSDDSSIFQLRINKDEDTLILYNPYYDGSLSTLATVGGIDCNGFPSEKASKFYGWKLGPKEAWEATDEWQMIGSFDNRYSASEMKFTYATSIGVETTVVSKASVPDGIIVVIGPDLFETFAKGIASKSDVAWRSTPLNVWRDAETHYSEIKVNAHKMTKIYQAVGHYGIFVIWSNYMQARDDDAHATFSNLLKE